MNEKDLFIKFQKMFDKNALLDISKDIIYQEKNGDYVLFSDYTISKTNKGYKLSKQYVHKEYLFCTARNAVVYATLDKRNRINEAKDVLELDRILEDANIDIEIHKKLSEKTKSVDHRIIYLTKLNESKLKKKIISQKLEDYITEVKNWQNQKFTQASK